MCYCWAVLLQGKYLLQIIINCCASGREKAVAGVQLVSSPLHCLAAVSPWADLPTPWLGACLLLCCEQLMHLTEFKLLLKNVFLASHCKDSWGSVPLQADSFTN